MKKENNSYWLFLDVFAQMKDICVLHIYNMDKYISNQNIKVDMNAASLEFELLLCTTVSKMYVVCD